ncbi:MAG TPA: YqgE/AlgH family protein [Bryobacteraceae bacterium]|nr:YqgE/AlgH family protein [Bryobacteraceae bacterium]
MVRWLLGVVFFLALAPAFGQEAEIAVGRFLVASRDLGDPNFAQTVILLVHYDADKGAVGLVINRRSDVPISQLFKDMREAKGRTDPVYLGGPVELDSVLALLKSSSQPDDSMRVFGNVYLIANKDALAKTMGSEADADSFHAYLGYAGWGPSQLEHEVQLGAWHIMAANTGEVFHNDPDSVWPRLIRRTELQIARRLTLPICTPQCR